MDFGDFFACQTVNLSFAIATDQYNSSSNFSPEVTVAISNEPLPRKIHFFLSAVRGGGVTQLSTIFL